MLTSVTFDDVLLQSAKHFVSCRGWPSNRSCWKDWSRQELTCSGATSSPRGCRGANYNRRGRYCLAWVTHSEEKSKYSSTIFLSRLTYERAYTILSHLVRVFNLAEGQTIIYCTRWTCLILWHPSLTFTSEEIVFLGAHSYIPYCYCIYWAKTAIRKNLLDYVTKRYLHTAFYIIGPS